MLAPRDPAIGTTSSRAPTRSALIYDFPVGLTPPTSDSKTWNTYKTSLKADKEVVGVIGFTHKRDQRHRGARPTTPRGAIHLNTTKLILNTF